MSTVVVTLECGHDVSMVPEVPHVFQINLGGRNYCGVCGAEFTIPLTEKNFLAVFESGRRHE
jgi:hypothetical protein